MFHNLLESMDTSEAASDTKGSTDAGKQTADSKSPSPLSAEVQKVSEDKGTAWWLRYSRSSAATRAPVGHGC